MNHWIFQGNPDVFDLDEYVSGNDDLVWDIRQRHLGEHMSPGDRVFIWRAAGKAKAVSGVVAMGRLTARPRMMPDDAASFALWKEGDPTQERLRVELKLELRCVGAKETIRREWVESDPWLKGLRITRMRNETNYKIEESESERLKRLCEVVGSDWSRAEDVAALWAFKETEGGSVSKMTGSAVAGVSWLTGRPIGGVYNKVMNFRHIDPRDSRAGLANVNQMDRDVWGEFYDSGSEQLDGVSLDEEVVRLFGDVVPSIESMYALGADSMRVSDEMRSQVAELFEEFVNTYPQTEAGQYHLPAYASGRQQARANYSEVKGAAESGGDVTDLVLLKLLPHMDTESNRTRGAWVHVAPTVQGDIKKWFESKGWVRPEEWPQVATAVLGFVTSCVEEPGSFEEACVEFDKKLHRKGMQSGFLTPILNSLAPESYIIFNNKSRRILNHLAGHRFQQAITDYPEANAAGMALVEEFSDMLRAPELGGLSPGDAWDMFTHWLVAVKKVDWARKRRRRSGGVQYWKIAPGEHAENWENCLKGGYIAIGWSDFGDVRGLSRSEFNELRDSLVESHPSWTKRGADQIWQFTRIPVGSIIVANHGTTEVLGIGRVTGECYFVEGERYPHRLPVEWFDVGSRVVQEGGWRRTTVRLTPEKVEEFKGLSPEQPARVEVEAADEVGSPPGQEPAFSIRAFELLEQIHLTPSKGFYTANKEELREELSLPLKRLFACIAEQLPEEVTDALETEKRITSLFIKQGQTGDNACWPYQWGAFYPKGGRRTQDVQLFVFMDHESFEYGLSTGDYGGEQSERLAGNIMSGKDRIRLDLGDVLSAEGVFFGDRDTYGQKGRPQLTLDEWMASEEEADLTRMAKELSVDEVLATPRERLASEIAEFFTALFPFVLMAIEDDPWPLIASYLETGEDFATMSEVREVYGLEDFVEDTGFDEGVISSWERRLRRKKHVIFQGPPGTGKTYVAERLARMLVSGTHGIWDVVQFHPSYAYEDFIQGLRPEPVEGGLSFDLRSGRFLEFCRRARTETGGAPCVLLIDEINRAHLSRVFGELMYLLEYRKKAIPLAAGGAPFRIPENVYMIGTMNTADRSIALVDHALRRRFSFIRLNPEYEVLQRYLDEHIEDPDSLVQVLREVNDEIGDPNYQIGISYFMKDGEDLPDTLPDIWVGEIEPYLEEFFYDNVARVDPFRWEALSDGKLSDWVE